MIPCAKIVIFIEWHSILSKLFAEMRSGVAASNIARFEQKGLISLKHLINIAMTLGYTSEVRSLFAQPKYSTMEELTQIRRNSNKKRAHKS